MSNITQTVQGSAPGQYVELFSLDTSSLHGPVMNFCEASSNGSPVIFRGVTYTPVDIVASGFEMNGSGGLPTPKIKVANSNQVFQAIVNTYGDLVGCSFSRVRTFSQFLDGAVDADPTAFMGPDIFQVERKSNENAIFIEWELSAALDVQGAMVPKRMVIRDTCTWRYRTWNAITNAFDYTKAQCPYNGALLTNTDVTTTDPTQDGCGRTITSCKLRFGANGNLPYGGFPGVARFQ